MNNHLVARLSRLLVGLSIANHVSACSPMLTKKDLHAMNPAAEIIDVCARVPTVEDDARVWGYRSALDETVSDRDRGAFERFAPNADTFYWYDPMAPSDSPQRLPWPYHHLQCSTQSGRAPELPKELGKIELTYEAREALVSILTQQCAPAPEASQALVAVNKQFLAQPGTPISVSIMNRKTFTSEHVEEVTKTLKDALRGKVNDLIQYGPLGPSAVKSMVPLELRLSAPKTTVQPIDSPGAQFVGGFISEVPAATVPGGALVTDTLIATGTVPEGTREARLGKALADIGVGAGQTFIGVDGAIIGAGATLTGGGAVVGAPLCVGSVALATNGATTFCNGTKNLIIVLYHWNDGTVTAEEVPQGQTPTSTGPQQSSPQDAPSQPTPAAKPPPETPPPAAKPAPKPGKPAGKAPSTGQTATQAVTQAAKRCRVITFQSANTTTYTRCTGQMHHAISAKIHEALQDHQNLKGLYKYRDNRFVTQAIDKAAHNGYQKWHIALDQQIVNWLKDNKKAMPKDFEAYLHNLYAEKRLMDIFPNGL